VYCLYFYKAISNDILLCVILLLCFCRCESVATIINKQFARLNKMFSY